MKVIQTEYKNHNIVLSNKTVSDSTTEEMERAQEVKHTHTHTHTLTHTHTHTQTHRANTGQCPALSSFYADRG